MKSTRIVLQTVFVLFLFFASSCSPQATSDSEFSTAKPTTTPTAFQPQVAKVFISSEVPDEWRNGLSDIQGQILTDDNTNSDFHFGLVKDNDSNNLVVSQEVFAVVVPFFTVIDEISTPDLQALWSGYGIPDSPFKHLIINPITAKALTVLWGTSGGNVNILQTGALLSSLQTDKESLAIIPFDEINPNLKVLKVDGISPLDKPMKVDDYSLTIHYGFSPVIGGSKLPDGIVSQFSNAIPTSNRDESKMTVIVMSGTTAITRATAVKVNLKGTDYPIEAVKDWFQSADIRHVSNEISVAKDCPEPDGASTSLRFCAQPNSIEVLKKLDVNVVELTGNHLNDYGTNSFSETLQIYRDLGWKIFGGGENQEIAKQPALIESNGNKIAFIGCNTVGPTNAWATQSTPGAASCDFDYLFEEIRKLKEQGYVVITTYQYDEIYEYMFADLYRLFFWQAAEAGAAIIQGSQAHFPMGFELRNNSFIHYGLGNFIFDQMDYPVVGTRREFVDRHIIYNGKYINTELLTAMLTDWSKPVPMMTDERAQFLNEIFTASQRK